MIFTITTLTKMIAHINTAPQKKSQSHRLNDQIAAKEKELTRITRYKQSLYQDWKDGEITQFANELRKINEYIEINTTDTAAAG